MSHYFKHPLLLLWFDHYEVIFVKWYSIGEFAQRIGRTEQTLSTWDKSENFQPHHVSIGRTRYYSQDKINHFLGIQCKKHRLEKNRIL